MARLKCSWSIEIKICSTMIRVSKNRCWVFVKNCKLSQNLNLKKTPCVACKKFPTCACLSCFVRASENTISRRDWCINYCIFVLWQDGVFSISSLKGRSKVFGRNCILKFAHFFRDLRNLNISFLIFAWSEAAKLKAKNAGKATRDAAGTKHFRGAAALFRGLRLESWGIDRCWMKEKGKGTPQEIQFLTFSSRQQSRLGRVLSWAFQVSKRKAILK